VSPNETLGHAAFYTASVAAAQDLRTRFLVAG
jgi:hypothetical protein